MSRIKRFYKFLKKLAKSKLRLLTAVCLTLLFFSIPPRLIYSLPDLQPKHSPVRTIDLAIPKPKPYPINTTGIAPPYLSAKSAIVVDVKSKAVIYMKNPNEHLYPASTTKMMTALVAIDEYPLDHIASISSPLQEGQVMGLIPGEQITIKNLLYGLLIHSGNDAAQALADEDANGSADFIEKMNKKVKALGLTDTHFTNPTGLEDSKHYASVHDLAIIGAELMSRKELADMLIIKDLIVTDTTGKIKHQLKAINELLGVVKGLKGIKTGWTESAGECFVSYTERDNHPIITAVLGSFDRFGETRQLIEWVYANHQWQTIEIPPEPK